MCISLSLHTFSARCTVCECLSVCIPLSIRNGCVSLLICLSACHSVMTQCNDTVQRHCATSLCNVTVQCAALQRHSTMRHCAMPLSVVIGASLRTQCLCWCLRKALKQQIAELDDKLAKHAVTEQAVKELVQPRYIASSHSDPTACVTELCTVLSGKEVWLGEQVLLACLPGSLSTSHRANHQKSMPTSSVICSISHQPVSVKSLCWSIICHLVG